MKVYRLFLFEIWRGIKSKQFYWLSILLFFIGGMIFSSYIGNHRASIGDGILYCLAGDMAGFLDDKNKFEIPILWLSILIGSSLNILGHVENFTPYGQYVFICYPKRYIWWLSQCLWNIVSTMLYFVFGFLALFFYGLLENWKIDLNITKELFRYIFPEAEGLSDETCILVRDVLFLVIISSIAWNLFQMYIAMYVKSLVGIMLTIVMLVCSAYFNSNFFPGSYMMVARSEIIQGIGGASVKNGYVFAAIIAAIAIISGSLRAERCDYLVEEE